MTIETILMGTGIVATYLLIGLVLTALFNKDLEDPIYMVLFWPFIMFISVMAIIMIGIPHAIEKIFRKKR